MKFNVNKTVLANTVKVLSKVINKRNLYPILGDILCEVKTNRMKMTAGDGDVTVETSIILDNVEGEGKFCISPSRLRSALSPLSDQSLEITVSIGNDYEFPSFNIRHTTGELYFQAESADEYPIMNDHKIENEANIVNSYIIDAIKRSSWWMAADDLRPAMSGMCFKFDNKKLDIVASNGHVLIKNQISDTGCSCNAEFIAPRKAVKMMTFISSSDMALFRWNDDIVVIEYNDIKLLFKKIDSRYPNYNSIIPSGNFNTTEVDRNNLLNALKKVTPFVNQSSKMVSVSLKGHKMTVRGVDKDLFQSSTDNVDVDYDGNDLEFGINGTTLQRVLKNTLGKTVKLFTSDANHPIIIEPMEQNEEYNILMLMMPMLLND